MFIFWVNEFYVIEYNLFFLNWNWLIINLMTLSYTTWCHRLSYNDLIYMLRTFTSIHAKIYVYFSIRALFVLHDHFSKTLISDIYYTLYFIKITNLLNFLDYLPLFTHNNHHLLSSFTLRIRKERIKN